ncbi:protein of unknown function [Zhouia amylolytica]|uniref:Bacteroides conjugative transposon TraN protein n=1 Tax=Zhouia amylolytica TaxID=376730 RepID=A0A1I6T4S3_9FLAO|nr:DUF4138 domain-containing protein [Zhouia amylolytica]SFS84186.1 protein of unknown function [Zhouia amylolytica]
MKKSITYLMMFCCFVVLAQQPLDTIYANEHKNVALFFPKSIGQGITGAPNFVFSYNKEQPQHLGLLQARPGKESNLLVVTADHKVFSYILKYKESLPQLNYFVSGDQSIGSMIPQTPLDINKVDLDSMERQEAYYKKFCTYLLKRKPKTMASKSRKGIRLQLQKVVYYGVQTYLVMELTNTSGITFDVKYLKVFRVQGNKKRKSSYQRVAIKPIYKYKVPDRILNGWTYRLVYVLPKFVLGDYEKLCIEVRERNGNRKVLTHWAP